MTNRNETKLRVAVVGGDGRDVGGSPHQVVVSVFPSRRDGGARGVRAVESVIRNGTVEIVILLVKWLGHSDFWAIKRLCAARGVRCLLLAGGRSRLRELVQAELRAWTAMLRGPEVRP